MSFDVNSKPVLNKKAKKDNQAKVLNGSRPPSIKGNLEDKKLKTINLNTNENHKLKYDLSLNSNSVTNSYTNPEAEIAKLQMENFDYAFYLKKIQHKILISIKDSNFLIADRSMVIFKNEKIIAQFISCKLDSMLIDHLIFNIKFHWSQDIKMISNLVIIKVISSFPETLTNLSEENKKFIQDINNLKSQNDDIWDIQFNLKAD